MGGTVAFSHRYEVILLPLAMHLEERLAISQSVT